MEEDNELLEMGIPQHLLAEVTTLVDFMYGASPGSCESQLNSCICECQNLSHSCAQHCSMGEEIKLLLCNS